MRWGYVERPDRDVWIRLALTPGLGPLLVRRLLGELEDPARLLTVPREAYLRALGPKRGPALYRALHQTRLGGVLRRAEQLEQTVLTPADDGWPVGRFAGLVDPPFALFLRGRLPPPEQAAVAIVGTREAGHYGLRVAGRLARALAAAGVGIVSGLALGIDGAAHRGALVEGGGGTVAVLGTGVDVPYPAEHASLKEEIAAKGGVVSEYPPGTRATRSSFPRRNRIVAALADVVVVVEAPRKSGALLTAQRALDMGRDVLVVPGPISGSAFRGGHGLLKRGAAGLCEGPGDVFQALGIDREERDERQAARPAPAMGAPLRIWAAFDETEVVDLAELCRRTHLSPGELASGVAQLELDGYITRVPNLGLRRL